MKKFALTSVLVLVSALAVAQGTYTQIDYPGATRTMAWGIDTAGSVSGFYEDTSLHCHGFLKIGGSFQTVDYPGAQDTVLLGMNSRGEVVGNTESVGFVYQIDSRSFQVVSVPGAVFTNPTAINNSGVITGSFSINDKSVGFSLKDGVYTKILVPGAIRFAPHGITASGAIAGSGQIGRFSFNFLLFGQSAFTHLTIPGVGGAVVFGISQDGKTLVGSYQDANDVQTAFADQSGSVQTLSPPGSETSLATSVDSFGAVVGTFLSAGNVPHGFLWTPPAAPRRGQ